MTADVFKEAEAWLNLGDDAGDVRPEVAGVFVAELFSGDGERLARISAMDDIHDAAPRSAVESGKIVPDRRTIQGRVFHPRHERCRRIGFPLNVTHSSISGVGDMEFEVKTASSGAEGEAEQTSPSVVCSKASGGR